MKRKSVVRDGSVAGDTHPPEMGRQQKILPKFPKKLHEIEKNLGRKDPGYPRRVKKLLFGKICAENFIKIKKIGKRR